MEMFEFLHYISLCTATVPGTAGKAVRATGGSAQIAPVYISARRASVPDPGEAPARPDSPHFWRLRQGEDPPDPGN